MCSHCQLYLGIIFAIKLTMIWLALRKFRINTFKQKNRYVADSSILGELG